MDPNPKLGNSVSPEKRRWVREESAKIIAKNLTSRNKAKQFIDDTRKNKLVTIQESKDRTLHNWIKKTKHSPFAVDLVAENERIHEDNQYRRKDEENRKIEIILKKEKAQNNIVLKV